MYCLCIGGFSSQGCDDKTVALMLSALFKVDLACHCCGPKWRHWRGSTFVDVAPKDSDAARLLLTLRSCDSHYQFPNGKIEQRANISSAAHPGYSVSNCWTINRGRPAFSCPHLRTGLPKFPFHMRKKEVTRRCPKFTKTLKPR